MGTSSHTPWIEALGYIGGVFLAICIVPQIIKVYRTKSAGDISYLWTFLYLVGLGFTMAYLILVDALAAYISLVFEIAFALVLIGMKMYFDKLASSSLALKIDDVEDPKISRHASEKPPGSLGRSVATENAFVFRTESAGDEGEGKLKNGSGRAMDGEPRSQRGSGRVNEVEVRSQRGSGRVNEVECRDGECRRN